MTQNQRDSKEDKALMFPQQKEQKINIPSLNDLNIIQDNGCQKMIVSQQETSYTNQLQNNANLIAVESNRTTVIVVQGQEADIENDDTTENYYPNRRNQHTNRRSIIRLQFLNIKMRKLQKQLGKLKEKLNSIQKIDIIP